MTRQEYEQLQSELESSDNSIKEFMGLKSIPIHQYYYWRRKYSAVIDFESPNGFVEITSDQKLRSDVRVEYPNGVVLNLQSYPGTKALLELINTRP